MAGDKMKQAKRALLHCINNLNPNDGFDIIRFSTEGLSIFGNIQKASDGNIKKAEKFIEEMHSAGGTNIEEALNLALKEKGNSNHPHLIIFITDGKPTIGETNDDRLIKKVENMNKDKNRIFTFGIGNEINTHLLDKITELTKATRSYISPNEDIEVKISSFYDKVQSPVLTNPSITYENNIKVFKTYPKELPDLFRGTSVTIFGRYSSNGSSQINLNGILKGEKKTFSIKANFASDNDEYDFIPPLWASRRIGYLLDQIRLNGEDKELVDEIIQLAREHGIVTPYTSYLIMEDEDIRLRRNELSRDFQTLPPIPELLIESGANYDAIKEKSGDRSITISEEFQGLNSATNFAETKQGLERMNYKDDQGYQKNLTQQVRNILGRAIYQSGKYWVDSELQNQRNKKQNRIQFNSGEYYKLLKDKPETSQFLALGQNV